MEKSSLNRRNFLRLGAAATAGFAAAGTQKAAAGNVTPGFSDEKKIIHRPLGNTGIEVPIVSMGVMRADNPNILDAAYKIGIKHFDTAHVYQNGRNEEMVGNFFKNKPRESVVIATKIKANSNTSVEAFLEMFETSLERLQMNYVDILYLHAVSDEAFLHNENVLKAMKKLKDEGRAKHLGFSTHKNMANLINAAVNRGFYEVILTSYNFRFANDEKMNGALKRAHDAGIGIVGMKNMAGGYLDEEQRKPVNHKAALKFALSNPHVHTCIPGIVSYEMLQENWSVAGDLDLSPSEKQDLELALAETGLFCSGCNECKGQCRHNLPVPELMRSYMYNYGYSYPAKARETVASLGISDNPCADCTECTVKCRSGFDIKSRVTNIASIQNVPSEFLV